MVEEEKSAEEQLHDAVWVWAGRIVMAAVLIGAGFFAGYMQWGDAPQVRAELASTKDEIVNLKNERETANTVIARERRDKEVCQRELRELKKRGQ